MKYITQEPDLIISTSLITAGCAPAATVCMFSCSVWAFVLTNVNTFVTYFVIISLLVAAPEAGLKPSTKGYGASVQPLLACPVLIMFITL